MGYHKPRSQRYSQRSSNPTKRSHDSVGSIPIPSPNLPQTTAIECLSELTPTTQLAAPSHNQPAKRARQTQSAFPHTTKKRKRNQIVSQQHLLNTQNLLSSGKNNQPIANSINARHTHIPLATITHNTDVYTDNYLLHPIRQ
jgi:hypothetical protein